LRKWWMVRQRLSSNDWSGSRDGFCCSCSCQWWGAAKGSSYSPGWAEAASSKYGCIAYKPL
jgi:hypothetical protein